MNRYLEDRLFRQGIERNFEIIGDALNALSRGDPYTEAQITGYRQVINLRHRLVHLAELGERERVARGVMARLEADFIRRFLDLGERRA